MFHAQAFYQAALAASSVAATVPSVFDGVFNTPSSRFQPPENRTLIGAWAAGTSLAKAALDSGSLIVNGRPLITPIVVAAPGGSLPAIEWPGERGLTLPALEQIAVLADTDASGAADTYACLFHTRGLKPMPPGPIRTVRATAASAGAKGSWFGSVLTFDTALTNGRYAIVGGVANGSNLALARFVFSALQGASQFLDRPGMVCSALVSNYVADYFRFGRQGIWGVFDNYNPPLVECLGFGTLTTQTFYLDLIKVA